MDDAAVDEITWYADSDGDGYGDASVTDTACDQPSGYVANADDCDDTTADIAPGAAEIAYNGVDEDCDGADLTDVDGDGYDAAVVGGADCDDTDARYNPGAEESDCLDPEDYNCDGSGGAADGDGDTYAACTDCNDADAAVHPGATEGVDDSVDQDCDGLELCFVDADGDTHRPDATSTVPSADLDCSDAGEAPSAAPTDDCDDTRADVYPGAEDVPDDGVDQDCDGTDATGDTGGDTAEPTDTADTGASGQGDNGDVEVPPEKIKLAGGCDCSTPGSAAAPLAVGLGVLLALRRRLSPGEPRR